MSPLITWLILIIAFVIVVGIFFKLIKVLAKSIAYAIIFFAVLGIIYLFLVNFSFQGFVSELDQKNLYLYEERGEVQFGYQDNPFRVLNSGDIARLNLNKEDFKLVNEKNNVFDNNNNIIVYTEDSLTDKPVDSVVFNDLMYEGDRAKTMLLQDDLSVAEKGRLFSLITQEWNSEFFFPEYRERTMMLYPDRLMLNFVDNSPEFLLDLFGFERRFRGAQDGESLWQTV